MVNWLTHKRPWRQMAVSEQFRSDLPDFSGHFWTISATVIPKSGQEIRPTTLKALSSQATQVGGSPGCKSDIGAVLEAMFKCCVTGSCTCLEFTIAISMGFQSFKRWIQRHPDANLEWQRVCIAEFQLVRKSKLKVVGANFV